MYTDSEFILANQALDGWLKELKRLGESKPAKHKYIVTIKDMEKLSTYFANITSAVDPTDGVWFAVPYHFALRGCES